MTRASQTLSLVLLASSVYLLLILPQITDSSPVPSLLPLKVQVEVIPVLPFWALITLASYLLGRLGLGVMTFKDTDEAYRELMGQIETAKKDLDERGVGWT